MDVGPGYYHLGAVLWVVLLRCLFDNDIHSAKIIMMLSQTFYRIDDEVVQKQKQKQKHKQLRKTRSTSSEDGVKVNNGDITNSSSKDSRGDAWDGDDGGNAEDISDEFRVAITNITAAEGAELAAAEIKDNSDDIEEDEDEDAEITRIDQRKVLQLFIAIICFDFFISFLF